MIYDRRLYRADATRHRLRVKGICRSSERRTVATRTYGGDDVVKDIGQGSESEHLTGLEGERLGTGSVRPVLTVMNEALLPTAAEAEVLLRPDEAEADDTYRDARSTNNDDADDDAYREFDGFDHDDMVEQSFPASDPPPVP